MLAPYDPTRYLSGEKEVFFHSLLQEGKILNSDGIDSIYEDVVKNAENLFFPNAVSKIEGNPNNRFMDLVLTTRPAQVTLVPDAPDALTSSAGWDTKTHQDELTDIVTALKAAGIRASIFVDPDPEMVRYAAKTGADRVELYTEPYASAYHADPDAAVRPFVQAALEAQKLGLDVNAGHDLSLVNLDFFLNHIPFVKEVSIGHQLICDALYLGLQETVKRYLAIAHKSR